MTSTSEKKSSSKRRPHILDLWQIIAEKKKNNKNDGAPDPVLMQGTSEVETNILFLGARQSGKTTLLRNIITGTSNSRDNPRSTTALEYTFARKNDNFKTYVAHLWELGGGDKHLELLDEIITYDNIHTFVFVIVLDLSKQQNAFRELMVFLNKIEDVTNKCYEKLRRAGSNFQDRMISRSKRKYGHNPEEMGRIKFIGVPMLILGNKFDLLHKMNNPPQQKALTNLLRCAAHYNAASLMFMESTSNASESEVTNRFFGNYMHHFMFNRPVNSRFSMHQLDLDYTKPIRMECGKDTFHAIESAPSVNVTVLETLKEKMHATGVPEIDQWQEALLSLGAQEPGTLMSNGDVIGGEKLSEILYVEYTENAVDVMRKQKDEEMESLHEEQRRQQKLASQARTRSIK